MELFKNLFGDESLTYEDFLLKLADAGIDESEIISAVDGREKRELETAEKFRELQEKHEMELKAARAEGILAAELMRQGALNPSLVAKIIDLDDIGGAEDLGAEVAGKVASLRQSEPYLFMNCKNSVSTGLRHGGTYADAESMSDFDYYSKYRFKTSM